MSKPIQRVWTFRSDSNPDVEYQTLLLQTEPVHAVAKAGPVAWPLMEVDRASIPDILTWEFHLFLADDPNPILVCKMKEVLQQAKTRWRAYIEIANDRTTLRMARLS